MIRSLLRWTTGKGRAGAPARLLRAYLRDDAPDREKSAVRIIAAIAGCTIPLLLALGSFQGWRLSISMALFVAMILTYCLLVLEALGRGWYHPAVKWMNSLLQVSIPLPFLVLETLLRGSAYALTSPVGTLWSGLVVFSALRSDPVLSITSGAVAAVELCAFYFFTRPAGFAVLDTVTAPWILTRAIYLLFSGFAGAVVAATLVRKAEDALRAVREQDLMGKYFLHERLGAGGMAEVFRATYSPEGGFQKTVAIKRILPALAKRPHFNELFLDEARLCALLNHPNVVQVLDVGRFRDTYILAMEYVDGMSLQRLLAESPSPLPLSAVAFLGTELGAALDYLHARIGPDGQPLALVHRDVNPPNVLISRFGEVKLGDFGIAHANTLTTPQEPGHFVGKSLYAAPEQRRCEGLDARSDLFSLGLTLYEAATRSTIAWESLPDEGKADFTGKLPRPSAARAEMSPELEAILLQLLEFTPSRRIQTGRRVRERLEALHGDAAPYPQGQKALAEAVRRALSLPSLSDDSNEDERRKTEPLVPAPSAKRSRRQVIPSKPRA